MTGDDSPLSIAEQRIALLTEIAAELHKQHQILSSNHPESTVLRADLFVYQAQRRGPGDDRIDQQWLLTIDNPPVLKQWQRLSWHSPSWSPNEIVPMFAAFCDPESNPDPADTTTLGHVASFRKDGNDWNFDLVEPVAPTREGTPAATALARDAYLKTGEVTAVPGVLRDHDQQEAADLRDSLMSQSIAPFVRERFDSHSILISAVVLVAQFWNDWADDEVHIEIRFSIHDTPSMSPIDWGNFYGDPEPDPDLPPGIAQRTLSEYPSLDVSRDLAVPALAAYCLEGGDQNLIESFTPYAVVRRRGNDIDIDIVGEIHRPWLDGVAIDASTDRIWHHTPRGYGALFQCPR